MQRYHLDESRLKSALSQRGFVSLTQFAQAFRLNRATIHHYFKGRGPISEPFYQLCDALEVDPLDLLTTIPAQGSLAYQDEISTVVRKLAEHDPRLAIGLFGSRVKGTAKKYSDWDLGVTGGATPIGGGEYLKLKILLDDLAEDLPRFVELINLDQAPAWFLNAIDYEPRFLGGNQASWQYFLGLLHGTQKSA